MNYRYSRDEPPLPPPPARIRLLDSEMPRLAARSREDFREDRGDRRRPRSRSRTPTRRTERLRSPEYDSDHSRERLRAPERGPSFRDPDRAPLRGADREPLRPSERDRMREGDRDRDRDLDRRRALSPIRDREYRERIRDREYERSVPSDRYAGGFSGGFPAISSYGSRGASGFGTAPYGGSGGGGGMPEVCFVCGGVGHSGRECPSNPEDVSKLRGAGSRIGGAAGVVGLDDPDLPKCFECGKRGHVAKECHLKQTTSGPFEQRCYTCNNIGHIARECTNPKRAPADMGGRAPPPRPGFGTEACYYCGNRGHFARECPLKMAGAVGLPRGLIAGGVGGGGGNGGGGPIVDRWLGGMPGGGGMGRGMGIGAIGMSIGLSGGGMGGARGIGGPGEPCFECGQMGHFARECPVRRASRAAIAAGSGLVVAGGEGRRIASKASMGSGRGEEAKLDNELDNYMKDRARIERDTEDDYEYDQRQREEEDVDKAQGRSTVDERSGREEVEMNGGKDARGGVEGRKEGLAGEEDEIQRGRDVVVEEGAEEEEMLNVES